ncbi:molybdopterin-dependent oxidoreductase [Seleniivibrio woodruffii]|uniref:molybdopterin-dependent oxidoreductase n=1 Tax=Seleniivibrio woodruffii TaxID=1078050 RepID=UPI0026ED5659|nr:molybdopterin-dependent oxidoreductase [Seleniivibrio woodruffii]
MKESISRRELLRMAAVASLFSAFPAGEALADGGEQAISHATHFGPVTAHVKNGKLVSTVPHRSINADSAMMRSLVDYVNSPNRIKTPCVRKSFLEGRRQTELRGAEEFVEVSWQTALNLAAEKLKEAKQNWGNESIFRTSFAGWSHAGAINRPNTLQGRFLGLFGGFTDTISDYSAGASSQLLPYVLGSMEVYSKQTSYEMIAANTKTIVLWGMDPLKSFRIDSAVPDFTRIKWYRRFKKLGIKYICVDPVYNDTAKELGAEWISVRPGTDTAMIIGMCYYLYTSGKYSKSFIDSCTVGFDMFVKYLLGKDDGVPKTPEWASKICGIPVNRIISLTETLRSDKTLIGTLYGPQRIEHGEQFHWSLITLASMLGNIGKPGSGINFGGGLLGINGKMPRRISQGRNPARTIIPASRMGEMLMNPGRTIDFNGMKITYPDVKLIYNMGANSMTHHQDINALLAGIRKVETMITHEIVWTPWAKHSDIVFPVTTTFEKNDIGFSIVNNVTYLWAMKQAVKPMYQAKDDYWVLAQLAKRLGFEHKFTMGKSGMEWVKWSYEGTENRVPFEHFWNVGYIKLTQKPDDKRFVRFEDFVKNPKSNPLFTPSGKIEIHSEKISSYGYRDCAGHPTWYEPKEWLGGVMAKKHRFHLLSLHPKNRLHSQMDNLPLANEYKVNGREPVVIHPSDAKQLGISDGDTVEVFNDRGSIICGAVLSKRVMRNVVRVDEGAWYAPEKPGVPGTRCISGNPNVLTSDKPTSCLAQACSAHSCLVSLRKLTEKIKPNTAYDNPVIVKSRL